jgi:hypothetical protein
MPGKLMDEIQKIGLNDLIGDLGNEYNEFLESVGHSDDDLAAMLESIDNLRDILTDLQVMITENLEDE